MIRNILVVTAAAFGIAGAANADEILSGVTNHTR
jgi:hypothetical protein